MKSITTENLSKIFREIGTLEGDGFKSRAYLRGAQVMLSMSMDEFNERKTFLDIPGIGASLNSKILEYRKSGKVPKLENLRKEKSAYLDPSLYKIRKGFISKRIPVSEIIDEILVPIVGFSNGDGFADYTYFRGDKTDSRVYPLGSVRRGLGELIKNNDPLVADVDLLTIGQHDYRLLLDRLNGNTRLTCIVHGNAKTTYLLDNDEKTTIDVMCVDEKSFPFSYLHFTGSARFNIAMRAHAKRLGYSLNQYALTPIKGEGFPDTYEGRLKKVSNHKFKYEEDIFGFLDYPFVNANLR